MWMQGGKRVAESMGGKVILPGQSTQGDFILNTVQEVIYHEISMKNLRKFDEFSHRQNISKRMKEKNVKSL